LQGILADGQVVQSEVEYLRKWFSDPARKGVAASCLPNELAAILSQVLEDGVLDEDEEFLLRNAMGAGC
jgi:hypothetical protein